MSTSIRVPDDARFTCQSCGRCCQGWSVPVDEATAARLRGHSWGGEPFEANPGGGDSLRTRLVDGRCFFLDSQNRCRIHTELSYEDKPAVCRAFPMAVLEVEGRRYARLSFWCPTVVDNAGKPVLHQARWINDTARKIDRRTEPVTIAGHTALAPRDVERIHQLLRAELSAGERPIPARLRRAAAILHELDSEAAKGKPAFDRAMSEIGIRAYRDNPPALTERGAASLGRRVLAMYLINDRPGSRAARAVRFVAVGLFTAGLTKLRCDSIAASASFGQIRQVEFPGSPAAEALVSRYMLAKLDSYRYLAGRGSMMGGLNLIAVAYGMVSLLARMRGASTGRSTCSLEDVKAAVGATDLLVVEHRGFRGEALSAQLAEGLLETRSLVGGVLEFLGQKKAAGGRTPAA